MIINNKKNKKKIGVLLGLLACFSSAVQAEDLLTLYHLALTNDPTFLASEAEMRANNEVLPQAFSRFLPAAQATLSSTGHDYNYDIVDPSSIAPLGAPKYFNHRYNTHSYGISLTQPIFHFDYFSQLKQSSYQKQAGILTYALRKQQLILRVAQSYFDLLGSLDNLQFATSQRISFVRELEQAQQRFEVGLIAITEVHEAKAQLDLAQAREVADRNTVANNKEKLVEIIGGDFQGLAPLKKEMVLQNPIPEDQHLWIEAALKHNLELQIARKNAAAAKHDIFNARSGHFPTLDLNANIDKSKVPPSSYRPDKKVFLHNTVSLNMTMPLFQGGAVVSKTRQAAAKLDQANRNIDLQLRTRTSKTLQAYRSIKSNISEINALSQAVKSSNSSLDSTRAAYEVGTRTILDVLAAETILLNAQRDSSIARYKYIIEGLNLKFEAGSLSEEDVYQVNQSLVKNINNWPEQYLPANYLPK